MRIEINAYDNDNNVIDTYYLFDTENPQDFGDKGPEGMEKLNKVVTVDIMKTLMNRLEYDFEVLWEKALEELSYLAPVEE